MAPLMVQAQTETLNALRSSRLRISAFSELEVTEIGSVSWAFVPKSDILVTALGFIGDPLSDNPRARVTEGLYDNNGRPLSSTTFANGGRVVDGNLYDFITPVTLNAGQRYVIGFETSTMLSYESKSPFFVDPNITFLDSHTSLQGGIYYPLSRTNLFNRAVLGVTFQFNLVNGGGIVEDPVEELWSHPVTTGKGGLINRRVDVSGESEIWSNFSSTGKGGISSLETGSLVVVPEPSYWSLVLLGLATFCATKLRRRED